MVSIKLVLNYIYYCFSKVYYKWDGEEADTASIMMSFLISGLMINLLIIIRLLIWGYGVKIPVNKTLAIIIILLMAFGILRIVEKAYKDYPIKDNPFSSVSKKVRRFHTIFFYFIIFFLIVILPLLFLGDFMPWNQRGSP